MNGTGFLESAGGFALLFFVPGFVVSKALFPEWRLRGPATLRRLVELVTLSFVLSVALTVFVGYLLLAGAPGGFGATWNYPLLEACLFGISLVALAVGLARGAYGRELPARRPAPAESDGEGAFELAAQLDELRREERRVRHELRTSGGSDAERGRLERRLDEIDRESADLRTRREEEYAR